MSNSKGKTVSDFGKSVKNAAVNTGNALAKGAEDAVEGVKEMTGMDERAEGFDRGVSAIREHMPVIASCGKTIGLVDRVEGHSIKLTKANSPDGQHHLIPMLWVERVDEHVHLNLNSQEAEASWQ